MQIQISASAHLQQARAQFAALTAQIEAMNAAMAQSSMANAGGTPAGYRAIARAQNGMATAFNQTLASSGKYRVEQLRVNDAVDEYTKKLKGQKATFAEVFGRKNRAAMKAVYREQLAMQSAASRTMSGISDGKHRMSLAIPTEVHKSWDTLNNRVGFFRHQLASASRGLLNWGKNTQWAGRQLMAGISMPVAAFGAAAGVMAYQVDKQFTRIRKVYDTTADANSNLAKDMIAVEKELNDLRAAGMATGVKAAKEYGSSITQTLEVQAELAATGQKGVALQESTLEVQRIAMLGEIDHGVATKALIALQSTLGHTVKQTADDFNYMNSIENATSLTTADFAAAIPRALAPMKKMGGSLQDLALLMVAMKERGIEAGEGANAIKAMMQRLYRPSAQVREEWQKLAGIDPLKIVEEEGGNIMQILPRIADAVNGLDRASNIKLLSGLFGTYQVTRMNAMLEGFGDMEKGIGQTSRALAINSQSWQDWAATAEREQKKAAESASGQFKRALETVKAELALIGEPFLEVASAFLTGVSKIFSFFNSMPDFVKKGLLFVGIFAALVGPVVMLVGLFANFAANIGIFTASALRLVSSFGLTTKAEWAMNAATKLTEAGFVSQASSTQMLTEKLTALTAASYASAGALSKLAGVPLPMSMMGNSAAGLMHGPSQFPTTNQGWSSYYAGQQTSYQTKKSGTLSQPSYTSSGAPIPMMGVPGNPFTHVPKGRFVSGETAARQAEVKQAQAIMTATNLTARDASAVEKSNARNARQQAIAAKATEKMSGSMGKFALAGAAGATAMGIMMFSSNETANSIAKMLMLGSFVVPAAVALVPLLKAAALWASNLAKSMAATAMVASARTGLIKGGIAGLLGGLKGIVALMGPVGWSLAALTTALGGAYLIYKHINEENEKHIQRQKDINDSTDAWASTLGLVAQEYRKIGSVQQTALDNGDIDEQVATFKGTDTGKAIIKEYEDASSIEQRTMALQQYATVLRQTNGDHLDARRALEVFYRSVGQGALEAQGSVQSFINTFGEFDKNDMTSLWKMQFEVADIDDEMITAEERGTEIGKQVADSIARAKTTEGKMAVLDQLEAAGNETANRFWAEFSAGPATDKLGEMTFKGMFDKLGIETEQQFSAFMADFKKFNERTMTPEIFELKWQGLDLQDADMGRLIDNLQAINFEDAFGSSAAMQSALEVLKDQLGITEDIASIDELRATYQWRLRMASKETKKALIEETVARLRATNFMRLMRGEAMLTEEQMYQIARGTVKTAIEMNKTKDEAKEAADEAKRLANNMARAGNIDMSIGFDFNKSQVVDMRRAGMEGAIEDLANEASEAFDEKMNNALDSDQAMWDQRIANQEAAQERAQKQFENRWERRKSALENYYDQRAERIDKAIEQEQKAEDIRQRIFDAEMSRLDRLNSAANRTIDFNLALQTGELDEAAKIANDMNAEAEGWALSDAADKSGRKSAGRTERLENRKDELEKQRDIEMDALEKREEAEREHLDKIQEMRSDALQEQSENAMEANRQMWENDKKTLDERIELFKSFTGRNEKELAAWMKTVGLSYSDFGGKVKKKGEGWAGYIEERLAFHVRKAGAEMASDNIWEKMGKASLRSILQGMGFNTMTKFKHFAMTGELPDDFGIIDKKDKTVSADDRRQPTTQHGGGWAGKDSGRAGVARTLGGLHPNETMIRAQKGEFIVNRNSARKHAGLLEAVNGDSLGRDNSILGGKNTVASMITATAGKMVAAGVGRMFNSVFDKKRGTGTAISAGVAGSSYMPGPGGRHRPVVGYGYGLIHDEYTGYPAVDFSMPVGKPIYAVADGRISRSYDIKGYESRRVGYGKAQDGYRSYGRVMYLKTDAGPEVLYAHLSQRGLSAGARVKGGSVIGQTGDTGNSSGPHLHFGANNGPLAWLKSGGKTINDGIAMLHRGETVLTQPLSQELDKGIGNLGALDYQAWANVVGNKLNEAVKGINVESTTGGNVSAGTYNVNGNLGPKVREEIAELMTNADVLALTDFSGGDKNEFFAWLHAKGWDGYGREGDSGLIWNRSKYAGMKTGTKNLNPYAPGFRDAIANYAMLKGINGAPSFWAVGAHTSAHTGDGGIRGAIATAAETEQFASLTNLKNQLGKSAPVLMMGDFNEDLRQDTIDIAGLKSNWIGNMKKGGGTLGNRYIDHLLASPEFKLLATQVVGGLSSNHNAALAQYNLSGFKTGGYTMSDGLAMLHKKETVLSEPLSKQLHDGLARLDSGATNQYNIKVEVTQPNATADEIAAKAVQAIKKAEGRKPTRRTSR